MDGNGGLPLPEVDDGLEDYDPNLDVMYTLDIKVRPEKQRKMSKLKK